MVKNFLKNRLSRLATHHYRRSFAKDQLDKRLEPFVGYKHGIFVEAGANDGILQSNTLYYERYFGWTGLLIEPVPELAKAAARNRPASVVEPVALGSDGAGKPITITPAGLMSTTDGAFRETPDDYGIKHHIERAANHGCKVGSPIQVPCFQLSELIDKHFSNRTVDLLSLDVEGYEEEALAGLDLSRHQPRFILIEERTAGLFEKTLSPCYRKCAILAFSDHYVDTLYELKSP